MKRLKKLTVLFIIMSFVLMLFMPAMGFAAQRFEIFFAANGGTYTFNDVNDPTYAQGAQEYVGSDIEEGATLTSRGITVTEPVYWDNEREFLGWIPYKLDNPMTPNVIATPLSTTPITTAQMHAYVVTGLVAGQALQFDAQWAGDDSDYYSDLEFNGYGADITFNDYMGEDPDTGVPTYQQNLEEVREWWDLRESDETLGKQLEMQFTVTDPVKTGATFEGWLEFSYVDEAGARKYTLISDTLYTTAEIMAKKIPAYNFAYVAKWSDVELKDYFGGITVPVNEYNTDIKQEIPSVPEAIQSQYASVDAVKAELNKTAMNSNQGFTAEKAKTVYMDVTLQIKNADGTWMTVTPQNFPKDGVETVLPYPAGTDKDSYDFVVAHMISSGEKAGQVEILPHTLTAEGIKVKFMSMSPVAIMSQEKSVAPQPTPTPAPTPDPSPSATPEKDNDVPKAGDHNGMILLIALAVMSIAAMAGIAHAIKKTK